MIFLDPPSNFSPRMHVVSCFCEHDGQILLLHRQDHKSEGNTWGVPAGKIDDGETPVDAMVRELQEEVSIAADPTALMFLQTVYVQFAEYDIVYHMYRLSFDSRPDVLINPHEHKDHTWLTPEEALDITLIEDEDACIQLVYGL